VIETRYAESGLAWDLHRAKQSNLTSPLYSPKNSKVSGKKEKAAAINEILDLDQDQDQDQDPFTTPGPVTLSDKKNLNLSSRSLSAPDQSKIPDNSGISEVALGNPDLARSIAELATQVQGLTAVCQELRAGQEAIAAHLRGRPGK